MVVREKRKLSQSSQKKKGITNTVMPWERGWSPNQQKKTFLRLT